VPLRRRSISFAECWRNRPGARPASCSPVIHKRPYKDVSRTPAARYHNGRGSPVRDDVRSGADKTAREQMKRNDEVAASAAPQGDGVPDDTDVSESSAPSGMRAPEAEDEETDADETVAEAERAITELRDKYLRLAAEFDNYRKRTTRERLEAGSRAQGELVKHIVDSLDDLGRVIAIDPASTDARSVIEGVDLVAKKLLKALSAAGLEIIDPLNQTFDPAVHEAVATEPALSPEDDHVVSQVFQPGYRFVGQLLRPARVVVRQWSQA
jgi:molecular chaperone GrpE